MIYDRDAWPDYRDLPCQKERIEARDWDVLLLFDGCRWDALCELLSKRGDVQRVEPVRTPTTGGTPEWTFEVWEGNWSDVTYVSGNPQSADVRTDEEYGTKLEEHVDKFVRCFDDSIFDGGCWDPAQHTSRPERVTERALACDPPLVVHYLQPHIPYVGGLSVTANSSGYIDGLVDDSEIEINLASLEMSVFELANDGLMDYRLLRAAYKENLVYAWRCARDICSEFDRVVVTADHGSVLGPRGWGHGRATDPRKRTVPWVEYEQ